MTSMDLLLHHRLVEQYGLDLASSNSSGIADRLYVENMPSSGPRQNTCRRYKVPPSLYGVAVGSV